MIVSKLTGGTNFLSEISLHIIHMPKRIKIVNREFAVKNKEVFYSLRIQKIFILISSNYSIRTSK